MPNGLAISPARCQTALARLHPPLHLCTSDCNQGHARFGMEEELTKFIKENSLCECKDCSTKEEDNKEEELTKFIKENSLCDCKDCSTKEEDTKEEELTNLIKENTLYDCKECSTKEEDTKEEEPLEEDDDGVISPNTSYSNGIHTSGDDMGKDKTTASISHDYCKY